MEALTALMDRFDQISDKANVDAVFGKPETVEGRVLIPVAEVMYGFGMGGGLAPMHECTCGCEDNTAEEEACCADEPCCEDEACCTDEACECGAHETGNGGGGGAGAHIRPIAYIEVGPEGTQVKSIVDEQKVALAGIMLGFWAVGWVGLVLKAIFSHSFGTTRS